MSLDILNHLYIYKDTVEFKNNEYGVNAFWKEDLSTTTPTGVSAETVFLSWYKEGEGYDYSKDPTDIKKTSKLYQRYSFDFFFGITLYNNLILLKFEECFYE